MTTATHGRRFFGVMEVGTHPDGQSVFGVHDLAGNAWEWVESEGDGALLGGSATSPASEIGKRARWVPTTGAVPDLAGVRCAYPPEPR